MAQQRLPKRQFLSKLLSLSANVIGQSAQSRPRRPRRMVCRLEQLEDRRLLVAATDLASIVGLVTNNSANVSGANVQLFRDNGDGSFNAASDTSVTNVTTGTDGRYQFPRITAGSYFVVQPSQAVGGRTLPQRVSPLVTIDATAVQGQLVDTIDAFNTVPQTVRDETNDNVPMTSSLAAPQVIGGERDLLVNKTSATGAVQLSINDPLLPGLLSFDSVQFGDGQRRITWDGADGNATTIDDTGLGGIDLTRAGSAAGIRLQIGANSAGGTAILRLYSSDGVVGTASRFSSFTLTIPDTGGTPSSVEFIPFSSFTADGGGGASLTSIGAIELEISGSPNVNGTAELVGTNGPTLFTQDFSNIESADLSLTKTANTATPSVGQNVTFTITVNNSGPSGATGVSVIDMLPPGLTLVSNTPSQGTFNPASGVWTIGAIAANGSANLQLNATVNANTPITNSAQINSSDQTDPDSTPGNSVAGEDDIATITVSPQLVDVSLSKTIDTASPNVGQNVTYTVTASNAGPSTATNLVIRDLLPSGVTFVSATPSQGSYNTTTGLWTIDNLAVGATPTLTLVGRVNSTGSRVNSAEVTAIDQSDSDSVPNNNVATEDDIASVTFDIPVADLSLTKSASNLRPNVGETFSFNIEVANAGPNAASGVAVTDILPSGVTFISSTVSAGTYSPVTGIWTLGDVAVGATPTLMINARLDSAAGVSNTARITASNTSDPDSTPGNNVETEDDQQTITVMPRSIDLSLTKTVDIARPSAGQNVVFTVTAANAGPDAATMVVVSDQLPAGLTFVSAAPSVGDYNSATELWTIGDVPVGNTPTLQITAQFTGNRAATNIAQVNVAGEFDIDSTPGNSVASEDDQASAGVAPATADLSLTKTVSTATPNVGDNVVFVVNVNNLGPDGATGVAVRDLLPPEAAFVSATPSVGTYDSTTGIWMLGTLAANSSATLMITATALSTSLITNTGEIISADQFDPDSTPNNNVPSEDDQDSATAQPQQIDLALTKTINNATPNLGEEVAFTIAVSNAGPSRATGIVVSDNLPTGVSLVTSTPSQGSFNTTTGAWTVGELALNGAATLTLVGRVDTLGSRTNMAQVIAADQADIDSTPNNNIASEDDQASVEFTVPVADLSLSKTASNMAPNVGENVTFSIVLNNAGPDSATGVRVTDILPTGVAFISTSLSAGTYDAATGIWSIGTLASGENATLDILARVETQGAKTNTARVTSTNQADPDSTPGNNVPTEDDQDQVTITPPQIDLSLTKTANVDRPSLGDRVDFTVTISNAGPSDASGVVVTDLLPLGLSLVSSSVTVGDYNAGTGVWNVGSLAAISSATLNLTATVDSVGAKINVAEVTAANQFDIDSLPGNGLATEDDLASVTITPASADLSLTKTIDNSTPNVGDTVTYTLTVNNAGPDSATNIVVVDQFPAGLTLVSSTPSVGTYNAANGMWTIPTLAANANATLRLVATVDTLGDKANTAEITSSSQFDPDSTPGNFAAGEDDIASTSLSPQLVDLALAKLLDNPSPNIGDTIQYTVRVTNTGPSPASGVVVTDQLPSGVTFVSSTPSQGTYNATAGLWNVGNVAVGETPTLTISATVLETLSETNTAEITAADQTDIDSTPGNNVATEDDIASVTFVSQVADLSLTKDVDNASPDRGDNVNFTLRISNMGPDAATDVVVTDQLPPGLTFVSAAPTTGAYSATSGRWTIPRIEVNSQETLVITAMVQSGATATNRAEVTSSRQFDPDSTPGNNVADEDDSAAIVITPNVVDVSVSASVDNDAPLEGETIAISILASNAGPANASGIIVTVPLPEGLSLVSANPEQGIYDPATGIWTVGALAAGADAELVLNATVDVRGLKQLSVEVTATDQFDLDSTPNNNIDSEDDQTTLLIRAPRLLTKRLFLAR